MKEITDHTSRNSRTVQYKVEDDIFLIALPGYHDETPVVCPRFSGNTFDHVNQSRDSLPRSASAASNNGLKTLGNFTKVENLKTRELMQSIPSVNLLQPPDEKLKQINKRLIALKKRIENFEEIFQREHGKCRMKFIRVQLEVSYNVNFAPIFLTILFLSSGYKPSHAEKMNDRYMKNAAAEIHKLRKEKQQLKANAVSASGLKVTQSNNGKKADKLKDVLVEIEKVNIKFLGFSLSIEHCQLTFN